MLALLALAASVLAVVEAPTPAQAFPVNTPAPPPIGGGGSGGSGSGGPSGSAPTFTCPLQPSSSSTYQYDPSTFSVCTYNRGRYQYGGGYALCPTGFDVWRFYSMSNEPTVLNAVTTSRVTVHNSCANGYNTSSTVLTPNPADAGGPQYPLSIPDGYEFTGPTGLTAGSPVYKTYNAQPSTFRVFDQLTCGSIGQCSAPTQTCRNLENHSRDQAVQDFTEMANGTAATSTANWAKQYWSNPNNPLEPGYLQWYNQWVTPKGLTPSEDNKARVRFTNLMMNINPAVVVPGAVSGRATSATWTTIATNYAQGVPDCSSNLQFSTNQISPTQDSPTPVLGVCVIPIQRIATGWVDAKSGMNLPNYMTWGGNRYRSVAGDSFSATPSKPHGALNYATDVAIHKAWRAAIAREVATRLKTHPAMWAGQHYISTTDFNGDALPQPLPGKTTYSASNSTDIIGAIADASSGAYCADDAAAQIVIPQSQTKPIQTISVYAPTLAAGGSLNPQTVSVVTSAWDCAPCASAPGAPTAGPTSLSATLTLTATNGYKDFVLYDGTSGGRRPAYNPATNTYSITLTPAATDLTQTDYSLGFFSATKANQQLIFTITSASGKYRTCSSPTACTNNIPYAITIDPPTTTHVVGATAHP